MISRTLLCTAILLGLLGISATAWGQHFSYEVHPTVVGTRILARADFNEDGKQDIAVLREAEPDITIMLGDGSGDFSWHRAVGICTSRRLVDMVSADIDVDTHADLVVMSGLPDDSIDVWVILGDGSGSFGHPIRTFVRVAGDIQGGVAVGRLNSDIDSYPDVAVATSEGPTSNGTMSVLPGNGDGTFAAPAHFTADRQPAQAGGGRAIVTGDFDEDGGDDIAVANTRGSMGNGTISIFLGDRSGGFGPRVDHSTCHRNPGFFDNQPQCVDTLDLHLDLITGDPGPSDVPGTKLSIFLGDGAGGFTRTCQDVQTAYGAYKKPYRGTLGEFFKGTVATGPPDIAVAVARNAAYELPDSVLYLYGNGDGTFSPVMIHYVGLESPTFVLEGDFNTAGGDTCLEIVVGDRGTCLISVGSQNCDIAGAEQGATFSTIDGMWLNQNWPNPFGDMATTIRCHLPHSGHVTLKVFDVSGRLVTTLIDSESQALTRTVTWDGGDGAGKPVSSGVYFCELRLDGRKMGTRKITIQR
jgi:hypothetical protein